jgi:UPF0755 protein
LSYQAGRHARHAAADHPEGPRSADTGVVALFGSAEVPPSHHGRSDRRHGRRRRRTGAIVAILAFLLVIGLVVAGAVIVPHWLKRFEAKDYPGPGTGSLLVQVREGQSADDIGKTLVGKDVVASSRAFVNAAKSSGRSGDFQPGFYRMRERMAAKDAVKLLLDPKYRVFSKVTLPEGLIVKDVLPKLAAATGISLANLQSAAKELDQLGIPDGYGPKSVEGFLFPQTYEFDPGLSATEVLQQLVGQYQAVDKQLNFDESAMALGIKPYQALIIASMVEGEAKFDADRAKVARVIYNRLAAHEPLGIDATSVYEARVQGKDPRDVNYTENSPYNTRKRPGLPPTAIDNPGEAAMDAAIHPASGPWKYYVVADAAGHLFFTSRYSAFLHAKAKCKAKGWGCG